MSFLKNNKKLLGVVGIMIMLVPTIFFIQPQKAEAEVPVGDLDIRVKESLLDMASWIASKAIIHSITESIVEWIRNDFNGSPGFITNFGSFATDIVDNVTGVFIQDFFDEETQDLLCNPWKLDVGIGLRLKRSTEYKFPKCTLTDVMNNAENFGKMISDFRYSTWDDWISIGQSTTNNPYGLYLETSSEMDRLISVAKSVAETKAQMNLGFSGFDVCEEEVIDPIMGETYCLRETTKTPGKYVEDTLSSATDLDMSKLSVADEIEEILAELAYYLVRRVQGTGGLLGAPEAPPPSTTEKESILKQVNNLIDSEEAYLQTKQTTLETYSAASSSYSSAKECYENYLGLIESCSGTMEKTKSYVEEKISYVDGKINNINDNIIPGLEDDIEEIEELIEDLESLKSKIENSSSYDELYGYYNEYYALYTLAHNANDQETANSELTTAQSIKEDADDESNNCSSLSTECTYNYGGY